MPARRHSHAENSGDRKHAYDHGAPDQQRSRPAAGKIEIGFQLNWRLAKRLCDFGNNGEGRTIFPASRIRLSQKIESLVAGKRCGLGAFGGFFPPGSTSFCVVPISGLVCRRLSIPICNATLRIKASSLRSTSNRNGPMAMMSPGASASFCSTGLPLRCGGFRS